ncbi:MAG TPA: hypothetical protein VKH81_19905 [Candidatus Angelobacter sp.]|nr:hypothetical protein [Candidatus Angelobacter sp.]
MKKLFAGVLCLALLVGSLGAQDKDKKASAAGDPKTVVLAKNVDANSVGLPKPAMDLKAGEYKYKAMIEISGQQIPLNVLTSIKEDGGAWMATDTLDTPNGTVVQSASLEKGTLIMRKLTVKQGQGPVAIELSFTDSKASGNITMGGQDRPVAVDLGGPIFADGPAAKQSISCLPLAEGYTTTYRNFDVQKQKAQLLQLKVTGKEKVTVPAGTFDTYKVEITSADGGADKETLWITPDTHQPVKESAVIASMGGAVLTQELMP